MDPFAPPRSIFIPSSLSHFSTPRWISPGVGFRANVYVSRASNKDGMYALSLAIETMDLILGVRFRFVDLLLDFDFHMLLLLKRLDCDPIIIILHIIFLTGLTFQSPENITNNCCPHA